MRRALSILATAALLVTLAACGGGDDEETSGSTTTVAVTTTVAGQTTPSYTGSPDSEFCTIGRANDARIEAIGASFSTPEDLPALLREAAPAVREAAAAAPPEIKSDVTFLADGFEKLLASIDSGSPDYSVVLDPRFQTAAEHLNTYGKQVCGITD
jgi:hypothetical protein